MKHDKNVLRTNIAAAEFEALHMEIADLKEALKLTIDVLKDTVYATRSFKEQRLMDAERLLSK